jgi:hypothetical protein
MQQARHGKDGASLLISVFARHQRSEETAFWL